MERLFKQARLVAVVAAVVGGLVLGAQPASAACLTGAQTFTFTGGEQCYTVPSGTTSLYVTANGGKGGPGASPTNTFGGKGAHVEGWISVESGQTLYVHVGGNGAIATGGYNGGGTGANSRAGGGGGATDIRMTSGSLGSRLLVAGGGGGTGAAGTEMIPSGAAGGDGGLNGVQGTSVGPLFLGGFGGTQTAGGAGGSANCTVPSAGTNGALGSGGAGGTSPYGTGGVLGGPGGAGGGGGGGGYYGGGGGAGYCNSNGRAAGGGGGSSFSSDPNAIFTTDSTGTPSLSIRYGVTLGTQVKNASTNADWAGQGPSSQAYETATIGHAAAPTPDGTVTYSLHSGSSCSGSPLSTQTVTLSGGTVPDAGASAALDSGAYTYRVSYSGDTNYAPASFCDYFVVSQNHPAMAVSAPSPVVSGQATSVTASVSGWYGSSTPQVTFWAYRDLACDGPVEGNATVDVVNGTATWSSFTPPSAGTYFVTATLGGDTNNAGLSESCAGARTAQITAVVPDTTPPSVSLTAPANGAVFNGLVVVSGTAGTAAGDGSNATLKLWAGTGTAGSPFADIAIPVDPATGAFNSGSVGLGDGTFTVRVDQSDAAGNTGRSATSTFTVDRTAPTTTDDVTSAWRSTSLTVHLTASDTRSGVSKTYYTVGANPSDPTTLSAVYDPLIPPVLANGHKIKYFSVDGAGNAEAVRTSATVRVDQTAPATSDDVPSAWSGSAVSVTLSASDAEAGVDKTYFAVNGTPTTSSSVYDPALKPVLQDGDSISYFSVDEVGNAEPVRTSPAAKVDTAEPSTTDDVPAGWVGDDVTVTLSAGDAKSGVDKTYFAVNGTPTTSSDEYDPAAKPVLQDGDSISYFSVDEVGNAEPVRTSPAAKVDKSGPSTTDDVPAGWVGDDVTVTLSASDAKSGVDKTYFAVNGTPTTSSDEYDAAAKPVLHDGDSISYFSVDEVGNAEPVRTSPAAKVDKSGPSTTDDVPAGWVGDDVTVTLSASDAKSGVDKTYFKVNGTPTTSSDEYDPASKPVLHDGDSISYFSVDEVGNAEPVRTSPAAKVDKTPPDSNASAPATRRVPAIRVDFGATDAQSGVQAVDLYVKRPGDSAFAKVATVGPGGHFDYTADAGDGDYAFYTRAKDAVGNAEDAPATADTTTAVDTSSNAVDDTATTDEDVVLTRSAANGVLANDTDDENDPLTAKLVAGPAHGTLDLRGDGSYTYSPAPNHNGIDSFTYRANDGKHDSTVAKATITITAVDDAPVAVDDRLAVAEDAPATEVDVLANDTDVDAGPKVVESVDQPAHGTVAIAADRSRLRYRPAADVCTARDGEVPDRFRYRLNGGGAATVTVTVTCADRGAAASTTPGPKPTLTLGIGPTRHGGQLLLDRRTITLFVRCGDVACSATATGSVASGGRVFGQLRAPVQPLRLGANQAGRIYLRSSRALRARVRAFVSGNPRRRVVMTITGRFVGEDGTTITRAVRVRVRRLVR